MNINKKEVIKLKEEINNIFKSYNRGSDEYDFEAYLDSNLTFEENRRLMLDDLL